VSDLLARLRTSTCTIHHVHACERCIAQHEAYRAWCASLPATPPELDWDDITVEARNEITIVGYCRCGHWFKCRDEDDRRMQTALHRRCTYRNRIEWHATPQLQLF
jgi:hypothetical protein